MFLSNVKKCNFNFKTFILTGNRKLELRGWIQLWQYKRDLFYQNLLMSVMSSVDFEGNFEFHSESEQF